MRTIVVFHAGNQLWYTELSDLAGKPVKGDSFVYAGKRYTASSVTESLGIFEGKRRLSGGERLLQILGVLFDQERSIELLATLSNIGSGDAAGQEELVLSPSKLAGDFDNLVFVQLKSVQSSELKLPELLSLARQRLGNKFFSPSTPDAGGSSN